MSFNQFKPLQYYRDLVYVYEKSLFLNPDELHVTYLSKLILSYHFSAHLPVFLVLIAI